MNWRDGADVEDLSEPDVTYHTATVEYFHHCLQGYGGLVDISQPETKQNKHPETGFRLVSA